MKKIKLKISINKNRMGNSLVVQWLGLWVFTAGAQVQSPVGELRSYKQHGTTKSRTKEWKDNVWQHPCDRTTTGFSASASLIFGLDWPPHVKSWLIGKDSDAGRDWGQEEKGMTEDEMAGWHHWLNGRESQWTPGVGDGQGGLACWDSWGRKESDMTEQLIWSDLIWMLVVEGCFVDWSTTGRTPGLYPPEASGTLQCLNDQLKHLQWQEFLRGQNCPLLENHYTNKSAWNIGDLGLTPGLGRPSREGNGNPLQYSCLENSMDREAWWATVHRVAELDMIKGTQRARAHTVRSLVQEGPRCHGATNPYATTTEAAFWIMQDTTTEAHAPRAHAPQEKTSQWEAWALQLESSPHTSQLEKACVQHQRPSAMKN